MAKQNTVSFKVFLQKEGLNEKPEVRRFGIDQDLVCSFSYLTEKLQSVFPALQSKMLSVSWKDADGDDVLISSDDELSIALAEMEEEVHKLYVEIKVPGRERPPATAGEGDNIHEGVTCDGCDGLVDGYRYKCIQCPDFDLCTSCEAKGTHSEHYMIRLPTPISSWNPHCGRRFAHRLGKSAHRASQCGGRGTKQGGSKCPYQYRGRKGDAEGRGHQGPGWLTMLANYLGESMNLDETPNDQNPDQQGLDPREKYLRTVGRTVANILDPFGIEVDVEVRNNDGGTENVNKPKESDNAASAPVQEPSTNVGQAVENMMEMEEQKTPAVSNRRGSPENEGWTVLNGETQPSASSNPIGLETGAMPKQGPSHGHHTNPYQQVQQAVVSASFPIDGPMMQNPNPVMQNPGPVMQKPLLQYVQVPPNYAYAQPSALPLHPKPHIAGAVHQMMSMGFTNQGGWLTQLLESMDGNISKALDVLQPVKK